MANNKKAVKVIVASTTVAAAVAAYTFFTGGAGTGLAVSVGKDWASNVALGLMTADWKKGDDIYYKIYWRYQYLGCTYDSIGNCIPKYKVKQTVAVYADRQYKKCVKLDTGFYMTTDLEAIRHVVKFA